MSILISMVQAGDIATNLLDKARRAAGLNQTQAQICLHLAGLLPAGQLAPRALSPLEMSKAMKSPGARVHNQLRLLLAAKRVSHAPAIDSNGTKVDQRQRKYMLTDKGMGATYTFWRHISEPERRLTSLLPKKEREALFRALHRLSCIVDASALMDDEALKSAIDLGNVRTYAD